MRSLYLQGNKNKPHRLVDSEDIIIVRTHHQKKIHACNFKSNLLNRKVQKELEELDYYPESKVGIYKIKIPVGVDPIEYRDQFRAELKQEHDKIRFAGRVLKFEQGNVYQIYTENIFVKFKDEISQKECEKILSQNPSISKIKTKLGFCKNGYFIEARNNIGQGVFSLSEEILNLRHTEFCHPELVVKRKSLKRNFKEYDRDPDLTDTWALDKINIQNAWTRTKGKNVKICIIDDGIDTAHSAFANKIYKSKDMLLMLNNKSADHQFKSEMHGTACASIACGSDGMIQGVAPDARLIPIRSKGLGSVLESEAFYWATQHGADIISCSWGPPDGKILDDTDNLVDYPIPDHTRLAIEYAATHGRKGKGCIILFAAGNGNEPIKFDGYASHPKVLAIGASNKKDEATIYTDYGSPIFCVFPSGDYSRKNNQEIKKDYGVITADRKGKAGLSKGDYFDLFDGTSASCPGMAGVIALMLSVAPELSRLQIKEILKTSCKKIGKPADYYIKGGIPYHPKFGYGLIDAGLAVKNTINFQKNNKIKTMANNKVFALHIGINVVSTDEYGFNAIPDLAGCVNDMHNMAKLVKDKFKKKDLVQQKLYSDFGDEEMDSLPTTTNIKNTLADYAEKMDAGDFLIVTYAGHGAPVPDENGDEEDGNDEAWVCYDDLLLDDDANVMYSKFKEGVKILVISDSCHSGTTTRTINYDRLTIAESNKIRYIPLSTINRIKNRNKIKENARSIRSRGGMIDGASGQIAADLILLAACADDQFAQEENGEGVFSKRLRELYQDRPNLNYEEIINTVLERMPRSQNPKLFGEDNDDEQFLKASFLEHQSPGGQNSNLIKKVQVPKKKTERKVICNSIQVVKKAEALMEKPLRVKLHSTARSKSYISELKIRNNQVSAEDIAGNNPWDKAHALLNEMEEKDLKEIKYIEPNIVSDLYIDEDHRETESRKFTELTKEGYLPTYPTPLDDPDCPNTFIWHLDSQHSQLRDAFLSLHNKNYKNNTPPSKEEVVTIGHIDTGVYLNHDSLPVNFNNEKSGGNITDFDKANPFEQQGHGHGTISILAGDKISVNNQQDQFNDYYGAHPFADVVSYKISNSVAMLNANNFKSAIKKAIKDGCLVVTMSMAGWPSKAMAEAVNLAYDAGIVLVTAGSNNFAKGGGRILPKTILYPARWERVIAAVGATYKHTPYLIEDQPGNRAAGGIYMQMCYGPKEAMKTTMTAYSPNLIWFGEFEKENRLDKRYVRTGGGTSSCAPQVAAAAALYLEKYKDFFDNEIPEDQLWKRAEIVRQALFQSAREVPEYSEKFGQGILQAKKLLSNKYSPKEILERINNFDKKKAKKAKAPKGFFKKIFKIFGSRSIKRSMQLKKKMLRNELFQLMHSEEKLHPYLHENLNKSISSNLQQEFIEIVLSSTLASKELKLNIGASDFGANISRGVSLDSVEILESENTDIRFTGTKLKIESVKEIEPAKFVLTNDEEIEIIKIEAELSIASSRDLQSASLEIDAEHIFKDEAKINPNTEIQFAICKEINIEGKKIIQWNFKEFDRVTRSGSRNIQNNKGQATIEFGELFKNEINRSLKKKIKKGFKVAISLVKWTINKKQGPDEVVASILEQENKLIIYNIAENTWNEYANLEVEIQEEINTWLTSNTEKLLVFHGLADSCEKGFGEYFADEQLDTDKYGNYVLGFNMADLVQGIAGNAKAFATKLDEILDEPQEFTILTRSRGGLVARYLLENNLSENITLKKLIQLAPPNQGTPIARDELVGELFNMLTAVSSAFGASTASIAVGKVLQVFKKLAGQIIALPGIDDMEENSPFLKTLNQKEIDLSNYHVIATEFELSLADKLLKAVLDNTIIDNWIFSTALNDGVIPFKGAFFENEDQDRPTKIGSGNVAKFKKTNTLRLPASDIFHTRYLESENKSVNKKLTSFLNRG